MMKNNNSSHPPDDSSELINPVNGLGSLNSNKARPALPLTLYSRKKRGILPVPNQMKPGSLFWSEFIYESAGIICDSNPIIGIRLTRPVPAEIEIKLSCHPSNNSGSENQVRGRPSCPAGHWLLIGLVWRGGYRTQNLDQKILKDRRLEYRRSPGLPAQKNGACHLKNQNERGGRGRRRGVRANPRTSEGHDQKGS